jgi:hypothetical protein
MSAERYITFKLSNGELWGLPLRHVAEDRARYYAARDPDTTYQEEFDYVMRDDSEGLDWFHNNTNYEDFKNFYVRLAEAPKQEPFRMIWKDENKEVDVQQVEYDIVQGHKVGGRRVSEPL